MNGKLLKQAMEMKTRLIQHRRWLHQHPETGFDLAKTQAYVRRELEMMGLSPSDCGKCGLVVEITGTPGKTILLRADMDALPIREETAVDFAAANGNMHACGHDLHTAMLLGAAKLLADNRDRLKGTVRLLFQAAEETLEGARDVVESGVTQCVDAAAMIHVIPAAPMPAGTVIVAPPGISAPSAAYFTVCVTGKGCHGAAPWKGVDALSAGAHILVALEALMARELPTDSGAVLTVGKFLSGTAGNAIAGETHLMGTLRATRDETMEFLKQRITDISRGIAAAFRSEAAVKFTAGCPALKNDPQLCGSFHRYLSQLLGSDWVLSGTEMGTVGGSEDFSWISDQVPSVMLALAAGEPEKGFTHPLHHPKVTFDESVLPTGTAIFAQIAIEYLSESTEAPQQIP